MACSKEAKEAKTDSTDPEAAMTIPPEEAPMDATPIAGTTPDATPVVAPVVSMDATPVLPPAGTLTGSNEARAIAPMSPDMK